MGETDLSEVEGLRNTIRKLKEQVASLQRENSKQLKDSSEEKYVNLVILGGDSRPHCERHGAMLAVNPQCSLYRCPSCGVGVDVGNINRFIDLEVERLMEMKE